MWKNRTKITLRTSILIFFTLLFYASSSDSAPFDRVADIPAPKGFQRTKLPKESFAEFLRNQKLNRNDDTVYLYDGRMKKNQTVQYAVLLTDIGTKDLQQCADAVIRLRAEYLYEKQRYSEIHFNFTNGETVHFKKYADGFRLSGFHKEMSVWKNSGKNDYSYPSFRKYLDLVFTYAGTSSLSRELKRVKIEDIQIGDVFIQARQPFGHTVIVMDTASNAEGKKVFLLAQSYMPAQSIHILKNPSSDSPWYHIQKNIITPEWDFSSSDLKRFP